MEYIDKYSEDENGDALYILQTDALDQGQFINFVELAALKETVDRLFSDEQSRILQKDLMGDYVCDGCTI